MEHGHHNADNISLTELLSSWLSLSPVVAWLSPGCKAYVELVSNWEPFVPVPCLHGVGAHIASIGVLNPNLIPPPKYATHEPALRKKRGCPTEKHEKRLTEKQKEVDARPFVDKAPPRVSAYG